jgi:hypothetical protein
MSRRRPDAHALAAEIVRRSSGSHFVRLSDPPKLSEQLQLIAARLTHMAIVIIPHKCQNLEEWLARYGGAVGR